MKPYLFLPQLKAEKEAEDRRLAEEKRYFLRAFVCLRERVSMGNMENKILIHPTN